MGEVRLQGFLKYGDCVVKALPMSLSTWLVDVAGMVGTTNARQFLYFLDIPEKPTRVSTAQHCGLTKLTTEPLRSVFHCCALAI